tara:strand:+ start:561 stop:1061 length:501 start_codon:yes stop_codon:yes gene_type:complete
MIKHKLFLKWWLFSSLIAIFSVFCFYTGVFHTIWNNDITKLSFIILSLFYIQSIVCGIHTWSAGFYKNNPSSLSNNTLESGWFMSDLFLSIGMVGTVIGFISMLGGFAELDVNNTQTVQDLIKELGLGMSTALYTTLVGLVCSILLKVQYFNISQGIENIESEKIV